MRFAPYIDSWNESPHVPMGSAFHCVPQVHALYFGPAECGRHLFARFALDAQASFLVVSDAQMALGRSEELVLEAVGEILERQPETRAFILCTGCQTAFIALDGDDLARRVRERHGVGCVYLSVNRMAAENTPGRGRVNVPGGDRFHTRSTLMRLIEFERVKGDTGGLLFLSDTALAPGNEALSLAQAPIAWVKTSAEWAAYDDFLAACGAAAVISTAAVWNESAQTLGTLLGVPAIEAPVGYVLSETDAAWRACGVALGCELGSRLVAVRGRAVAALADAVAALGGEPIDLDLRGALRPWNLAWALVEAGCTLGSITLDGHALRYREQDDEPWYRRVREKLPQLVADCERRARENDHPHGASLLVAEGRWEAPLPARPEPARREGAYWGYGAVEHLAGLLHDAAEGACR